MTTDKADLAALKKIDPGQYRSRVRIALLDAGTVVGAARDLGVSHRTLCRHLAADPTLKDGLKPADDTAMTTASP